MLEKPHQIGRYEVERELGHGGMAVVFLARDPLMNRLVAVKLMPQLPAAMDAQFRARFQREAQIVAGLEHPGIVPIYDYGTQNGQPYIVMRYMPGGSLEDRIKHGSMDQETAVSILDQIAPALDYAHNQGVVHRDLKPGNILFDQVGTAYIADFGIAKMSDASVEITGTGIIGTPAYMSPEQAMGKQALDGRSDIYALGIVVYQMLTGTLPYQADTPLSLAMAHILEPVPDILEHRPDLPAPYQDIIRKALAKDPADRYSKAVDLLLALHGFTQKTSVNKPEKPTNLLFKSTQTQDSNRKPKGLSEKSPRWVIMWLIVSLVVIGGGLWLSSQLVTPDRISTKAILSEKDTVSGQQLATTTSVVYEIQSNYTTTDATPTSTSAKPVVKQTNTAVPNTSTPAVTRTPTQTNTSTPAADTFQKSATATVVYYPIVGCAASRIEVGDSVYVAFGGGENAIRSEPDTRPTDNKIGTAVEGEVLTVIGGPECNYGWILWQVRTDHGVKGWTPESNGEAFWLNPIKASRICQDAPKSRLKVATMAYVGYDPPMANKVREEADIESKEAGKIQPGEKIEILNGPACEGGFVWWEIRSVITNLRGWTIEGDTKTYWLIPIPKDD